MPDVLDANALQALLRMVGDDPEFVGEVVDEYLADASSQLAAMRAAVGAGDAPELARAAHTLKGTSLNVGAAALSELCREIEHRARTGGTDGLDGLVVEAEQALAAVAEALSNARERDWVVG